MGLSMSKYEPLEELLRGCVRTNVELTFGEVEQVLGFRLPDSARRYRGWWANEAKSHVQARSWMNAGWQTWDVKLSDEKVLFRRRRAPPGLAGETDGSQRAIIDLAALSYGAARLVRDYAAEADGDIAAAISRGLDEAAMARRAHLIELIRANAPKVPGDSTDLIREDRDAR